MQEQNRPMRNLMIIYRPVAPLAVGRSGLKPALAAMAMAAVLGTGSWQALTEAPGTPDAAAETD